MSRQGERIGNRLAKRHGLTFRFDPCNFRIRCDRVDVARNLYGGNGAMQWVLWIDSEPPDVLLRGRWTPCEIGSDFAAGSALQWSHWRVRLDDSLSTGVKSGVWIGDGNGKDSTDVPV